MGIDVQKDSITVAGCGDMSGDVFGNGMLLSKAVLLVAAFDHRHIFLDPMPDPGISFAERKRLFELPRSSWGDYDPAKLSAGGGVFSRQAKSIVLSPEVRAMLGLAGEEATPADVMRAILSAKADLLWFGGIGTYVRASTESNADAGDRNNDGIRITASELDCVVIGEGANLGMTQAARIEAALRGIRLNTDFIDNSAGVNTSDQEVNIKIALGPAVRSGRLGSAERSELLVRMTDDVAAAVLRNNYQQSLAISLAQTTSGRDVGAWGRLMRWLESREQIDRQLDGLPSDAELADRSRQGAGLTRPEIAVLLSQAKIALLKDLLESPVPDETYFSALLTQYFPPALSTDFSAEIAEHRLRREIVATSVTNGVVNRLGPGGVLLIADATGRPVTDVAFGFVAAREMLDLPNLWRDIDALDGRIPGRLQLDLHAAVQSALFSAVARLMGDGVAEQPLAQTIDRLIAAAEAVRGGLSADLPPATRARIEADREKLTASGVPDTLAAGLSRLPLLAATPDILAISARGRNVIDEAARAYLDVGGYLRIDEIASRAQGMAPADDYERLAIGGGVASLGDAHRRLAIALMAARRGRPMSVGDWLAQCGPLADRARGDLERIAAGHDMSVARLAVASARLGGLAQAVNGSAGG
jgi:glutamate dehydrogenase